LIHFTRYATPNTFHGFVPECIFTDDDDDDLTNGTPNYFEILEAFSMHGIGPGVFPNFVSSYEMIDVGDGDGYLEAGEQLRITPEILADDSFAWPNIEGLRAVLRLTGSETVTIVDSISIFATNIAPGDVSIGDAFLISALSDFTPHMAELCITYYAENSPLIVADTFEIYVGYPQLLLVDDDPDTISQIASYYIEALEELGVTYLYHRTLTRGRPTDMNDFPAMLWFTASDTFSVAITDSDTSVIAEFLDGGGHLILTGQNLTGQFAPSFLSSRFGAIHYSTGASVLVNSLNNPWLDFGGENLILIGAPGAGNQRPERLTSLTPISGEPIFEYSGGDVAAIASDNGTNKTAIFGFGIEGLGGTTFMHLPELLEKLFRWFDMQFVSIDDNIVLPSELSISVYPNPFNAVCRISTGKGVESIEIFNISGQLVDRLEPDPAGIISWNPSINVPGGVYLIQVQNPDRSVSTKAVLLR
ncbi:MAG TPA: T9SS type A sorting domain-containing protein, partial [candidate division Zixibacteria bacterium]|nr:T9SS type A sorting domain-containing protein [candidate division Zixibacteria bacterium]